MARRGDIPDMRFINREVPIADVARVLDLRLDGTTRIHCWHPERHQHGDRTASVGVRATNNTVKCFGCDSKPMGPIDLVMDVHGTASPADAALWIADRFTVPSIPARKRLTDADGRRDRVGYERGLGLLIRSGLWARLSGPAQAIAAVLLEFGERGGPLEEALRSRWPIARWRASAACNRTTPSGRAWLNWAMSGSWFCWRAQVRRPWTARPQRTL